MIVFLEGGTAAGGVGDDGVEVFAKKCGEIVAREFASGIANAGVGGERAAAKLIFWDDHFAAVGGEDADGGFVELRECDVGDASGEKRDAGAAGGGGGEPLAPAARSTMAAAVRQGAVAPAPPATALSPAPRSGDP